MGINPQIKFVKTKLRLLALKPEFASRIVETRKKYGIQKDGIRSQSEIEKWHKEICKDERQLNNFSKDLNELLSKFYLSKYYKRPIRQYLLCNNFDNLDLYNLELSSTIDKDGKERIFIEIFTETRKEDIIGMWGMVKLLKEKLPGYRKRRREIKDLDKKERTHELLSEKKSYLETARITGEKFKERISYSDVSRTQYRFKKKIKDT